MMCRRRAGVPKAIRMPSSRLHARDSLRRQPSAGGEQAGRHGDDGAWRRTCRAWLVGQAIFEAAYIKSRAMSTWASSAGSTPCPRAWCCLPALRRRPPGLPSSFARGTSRRRIGRSSTAASSHPAMFARTGCVERRIAAADGHLPARILPVPSWPADVSHACDPAAVIRSSRSTWKPAASTRSACNLPTRGFPIRGDRKYGARQKFAAGIALHSRRLVISHPVRKQDLDSRPRCRVVARAANSRSMSVTAANSEFYRHLLGARPKSFGDATVAKVSWT